LDTLRFFFLISGGIDSIRLDHHMSDWKGKVCIFLKNIILLLTWEHLSHLSSWELGPQWQLGRFVGWVTPVALSKSV
jgi:hypothetical protein